jgi:hypothetical protein
VGIATIEENIFLGSLDTGKGHDIITGTGSFGIQNSSSTFTTGDGDDRITGNSNGGITDDGRSTTGISNHGPMDTGDGNDIITGTNIGFGFGITNSSDITTGNGNDIITGSGGTGIYNVGTINAGNGEDFIISQGSFFNSGGVFYHALENFNFIGTGDSNDIITSTGVIYNEGVIETGNGDDSIIVDGGVDDITGTTYGIYNNGGAINMGDGNDSIIANEGFESGPNSSGAWFLGEGDDYIKGFGSGDFYGGNGNDTLELTPGTYTVGIWGEGGESPIFTKNNQLMITSEFERLIAGSTIYDFTSLTAGQIIVVA